MGRGFIENHQKIKKGSMKTSLTLFSFTALIIF